MVDAPSTGHAITFLSVPQVLLDTVPPGAMANEATWMRDLLVDPQTTGVVLVSLPEELPVNETLELHQALLKRVHITPAAVVLNAFIRPRFNSSSLKGVGKELEQLGAEHLSRSNASAAAKLKLETLGLPVLLVPRMFAAQFDRAAIELIAKSLEGREA